MKTLTGWKSCRNLLPVLLLAAILFLHTGCGLTTSEKVSLISAGAIVGGLHTPGSEIRQVYYLGVFDPMDQVPPLVYRLRVHGQGSFISRTKFGSGWVPAAFVDTLGTTMNFSDKNTIELDGLSEYEGESSFLQGRKFVVFGPEGFREVPKEHRLAIVMGTRPQEFFESMDLALGTIAEQIDIDAQSELTSELAMAYAGTVRNRDALEDLIEQFNAAQEDE